MISVVGQKGEPMDDLISRQAAIDALDEWESSHSWDAWCYEHKNEAKKFHIDAPTAVVENLPSAQTNIIACGDCKYWICHDRRCGFWNHGVKPLDWCSHAERRNE
jgi:hypothetical protein